jgi:hypothetical protein
VTVPAGRGDVRLAITVQFPPGTMRTGAPESAGRERRSFGGAPDFTNVDGVGLSRNA